MLEAIFLLNVLCVLTMSDCGDWSTNTPKILSLDIKLRSSLLNLIHVADQSTIGHVMIKHNVTLFDKLPKA